MSKQWEACDIIVNPSCETAPDIECGKLAVYPYKGGGPGEYVCLECAASMADDVELIEPPISIDYAILTHEIVEWKSRALAAEARVAFLEEHGRDLFKAYDAEEGVAVALVKLEMALRGGPVKP